KYLWKNPNLTNWGDWLHHFERDEFQNRGAIHTHGIAYLSKSIPELIDSNIIRADMPDPNLEPELYELVKKHQIHTCNLLVGVLLQVVHVAKKVFLNLIQITHMKILIL